MYKRQALAAGQVNLQIGVEPVIFSVGTGVGFEIGIHHIDEHLVAVHFGTSQRQGDVYKRQILE